MEEILASIRRIISDEVATEATPATPAPAAPRSGAVRPLPARDAQGREVPSREASLRAVPTRETPVRGISAREPSPFHATPSSRPAGREPLSGPAAPMVRSGFEAPAPLRPRGEPSLPVASAASRPAPLPSVAASTAESPYSYGSASPGFRTAPPPPNYAPAGRSPSADPFATRSRSLSAAPALPVAEEPVVRPVPQPAAVRSAAPMPAAPVPAAPRSAAPAGDNLDAPLASVLLDLALVEQAVQAELANVALESAARPLIAERAVAAPAMSDELAIAVDDVAGAPPAAETADMKLQAQTHQDSEPAEAAKLEAAEAVTSETLETGTVKPEEAEATAAPAKEAPSLPRAFVPSFRSEPRLSGARLPDARVPELRFPESRTANRQPAVGEPAASAEAPRERLVSAPTNNAVTAAFGSLHRSVTPSSRSVDDLVSEALRPMLKTWLDENLPALVERLVRAEIERVARQGQ